MENVVRRRPTADPLYPDTRILRCAFTGYRPMKMPFGYNEEDPRCIDFKHRLRDTIEMLIWQGYAHFLSGGAMGMDIMAAEAVLELQKEYPEVTLEIAVPFEGQAAKWPADYRNRWQECIDRADMVTVLSHEYTKRLNQKRHLRADCTATCLKRATSCAAPSIRTTTKAM